MNHPDKKNKKLGDEEKEKVREEDGRLGNGSIRQTRDDNVVLVLLLVHPEESYVRDFTKSSQSVVSSSSSSSPFIVIVLV